MQVCICHPKLVQTGLDLLDFPTILFYETGYSTYVCGRQAAGVGGSGRSNRSRRFPELCGHRAGSCFG